MVFSLQICRCERASRRRWRPGLRRNLRAIVADLGTRIALVPNPPSNTHAIRRARAWAQAQRRARLLSVDGERQRALALVAGSGRIRKRAARRAPGHRHDRCVADEQSRAVRRRGAQKQSSERASEDGHGVCSLLLLVQSSSVSPVAF